ncbi:condensation domain-containing protein, partial [Croceitalea sp. MTPC5]|uniref:condensation domain-containing protein n=1 Tax=Croceitalea sp. MTPC5 TaxID=3056565 RepID=UPI0030CD1D91
FQGLLARVHGDQVSAQQHQDLPFERLVDELGIERDLSRHPVFQVSFAVQSFGSGEGAVRNREALFRPYKGKAVYGTAKFDLSIAIDDGKREIVGYISYADSLFERSSIEMLVDRYRYLLEQLAADPDVLYGGLSLMRPAEYDQVVK